LKREIERNEGLFLGEIRVSERGQFDLGETGMEMEVI
jgi:hypothetical protein